MPDLELKKLADSFNTAFTEFKNANDAKLALIEKKAGGIAGFEEKMAKIETDLSTWQGEYTKRLGELEAKALSFSGEGKEQKAIEAERKMKMFDAWCRKGIPGLRALGLSDLETKDLFESSDPAGGYLAPGEYQGEIIKNVIEFSPIREISWVRSTSRSSSTFPKKTADFAAGWVAEKGTRSETTGLAYGVHNVPNHEMYAVVPISTRLLEDSVFNLEAELRREFAEQFAKAEGTAFVNGTGAGQPKGITTYTASTDPAVQVRTCADTTNHLLAPDDLILALYDLKAAHAARAVFLFLHAQVAKIRAFKSTTNQYLMAPLTAGEPPTILGRPYRESPDLLIDGTAAGRHVGLVGNFSAGYGISDRVGLEIVRDPYTMAETGQVKFTARMRVGGQVVLGEAITKIVTG